MRILIFLVTAAFWAGPLFAQAPVAPAPLGPLVATSVEPVAPVNTKPPVLNSDGRLPVCGGVQEVPAPAALPPAGSGPVVYQVVLCFPKQGNQPLVDAQTYLYYMQSPDLISLPSQDVWKPYNEAAEQTIVADHKRLWSTNFLDDLKIEAVDFPFSNGVIGKVIVYEMEERQRIKNTVYNEGTKAIEQSAVEEKLRELGI